MTEVTKKTKRKEPHTKTMKQKKNPTKQTKSNQIPALNHI